MTDKKWDILGLGSSTVDDLFYVPAFPTEDTKLQMRRRERRCGGLTATALRAAARVGARPAFAGLLGHDEISAFVETALTDEGVDVSPAVRRDDAQPIYAVVIVSLSAGTRTIVWSMEGRVGADDTLPDAETIRAARVLFIDDFGMVGNLRTTEIARAENIPIVADFENDTGAGVEGVLALVDHPILSARVALHLTGAATAEEAVRRLWHSERAAVVVTGGMTGCWYTTDGHKVAHQPAFPVEAVDTTGCGDVFHGAYAALLPTEPDIAARVRFASAVAALKATAPGLDALTSRAAVEAFMEARQTAAGGQ
jgi:sugar/nucleoside kinase (ribokinase family)